MHLTVSAHALGVSSLPVGAVRAANGVVGTMALDTKTTVLAASRGEATSFAVLVNGVNDPVDAGVVSDDDVVGVDKDHFEILVGGILVDPVRVQHTQVGSNAASTFLGNTAQVANELELVNTLVLGLAVNNALVVGSLAATAANSDTVDDKSLLGLVSKLVGLVSSGGAVDADDLLLLAVLPRSAEETMQYLQQPRKAVNSKYTPNTKKESQNITLLLSPDFLKILVGSHYQLDKFIYRQGLHNHG